MVVIFFGFETGSRQREGMEPLSALPTVTLYLFSNWGFSIRDKDKGTACSCEGNLSSGHNVIVIVHPTRHFVSHPVNKLVSQLRGKYGIWFQRRRGSFWFWMGCPGSWGHHRWLSASLLFLRSWRFSSRGWKAGWMFRWHNCKEQYFKVIGTFSL